MYGKGKGGNHLFAPYRLNYSLTDLMTDLPMVCKSKFVRYSHIKKELCSTCLSSIMAALKSPKYLIFKRAKS